MYPGMIVINLLIHNIYKLFSMTVVRFVEMNFEQRARLKTIEL